MKRVGKVAIEILVSLGYPALLSLFALSLLFFTSEPNPDNNAQCIVFSVIAALSFVATILYGVWDWDREPIAGFVYRLLFIVLRIAVFPVFFMPFIFTWPLVFNGIAALFGLL